MKLSIVIPGLNISETIGKIISELSKSTYVDEIIVVDNNSTDLTYQTAKRSGATVVKCSDQGLGYAMKYGIKIASNSLIMKIDGDIKNPNVEWVDLLVSEMTKDVVFVNGVYVSDYDEFPVGNLVAKPAIRLKFPDLSYVEMPLSGIYVFKKAYFVISDLPDNWAFDLAMVIKAHQISGRIGQIKIGKLSDKRKSIVEYSHMAYDLLEFVFLTSH
jgi:glucosyl-3-phosphoglycerate synthase